MSSEYAPAHIVASVPFPQALADWLVTFSATVGVMRYDAAAKRGRAARRADKRFNRLMGQRLRRDAPRRTAPLPVLAFILARTPRGARWRLVLYRRAYRRAHYAH